MISPEHRLFVNELKFGTTAAPMYVREVTMVLQRPSGEISYLLGPWGAADADEAITDIESGTYDYRYRAAEQDSCITIEIDSQARCLRLTR